jgi:hypothetical protein
MPKKLARQLVGGDKIREGSFSPRVQLEVDLPAAIALKRE